MPFSQQKMILLAFCSAANLAMGMALQLYGVVVLGAGASTDIYFAAQSVPMILSAILSGALTNNLTPILAGQGVQASRSLIRLVAGRLSIPLVAAIVILSLTARFWVAWLFSGLSDMELDLVVTLVPIICATYGVAILTSISVSGLYARGDFYRIELMQLVVSMVMLAFLQPVVSLFGVVGFAGLLLLRSVIVFVAAGAGFLKGERVTVVDQYRELWSRMTKIIVGSVIFKLGPLVDRSLSSIAGTGMLTSIGVGQQIAAASANVTDRVLSRPLLATAGARFESEVGAGREVSRLYRRQLRIVGCGGALILASVVVFGLLVTLEPALIDRLHLHAFGHVELIAMVVLSAIPAAASQLSSVLMYAMGKPEAISRLALISFALSTAVKLVGFFVFGIYAVAFGIILYQVLNWLFLHTAATRALDESSARSVTA